MMSRRNEKPLTRHPIRVPLPPGIPIRLRVISDGCVIGFGGENVQCPDRSVPSMIETISQSNLRGIEFFLFRIPNIPPVAALLYRYQSAIHGEYGVMIMYIVEPSALGSCINRHLSRQWLLVGKRKEQRNRKSINAESPQQQFLDQNWWPSAVSFQSAGLCGKMSVSSSWCTLHPATGYTTLTFD